MVSYLIQENFLSTDKIRSDAMSRGEIYYFTGLECRNGHVSNRYVKSKQCVECFKINKKKLKLNRSYQERQKEYRSKFEKLNIYGLTKENYLELIKIQNNKCKICGNEETAKYKNGKVKALAIDHCHETDIIRGLLCQKCNIGLGHFKNNPKILRIAAIYCEQAANDK